MKVKLHNRMAGPDGNYSAGDIVDLSQQTAVALLDSHQASPVKEYEAETADFSAPETAEFPAAATEKAGNSGEKSKKKTLIERLTGNKNPENKGL